MPKATENREAALQILHWLEDCGVDECLGEVPRNSFAEAQASARQAAPSAREAGHHQTPEQRPVPARHPPPTPPAPQEEAVWHPRPAALQSSDAALSEAVMAAAAATSLEALHEAIQSFEGCKLKREAMNTVIARGNPKSEIMIIGEAPGGEEDQQGKPFVGRAGQLLERMLAAIGLEGEQVFITNMLFWRPPGNRTPEPAEIELCRPFIERQISLLKPRLLIFMGGVPAKAMLRSTSGITRLRGRWHAYEQEDLASPIPARACLHPAYLLKQPAQKRDAWRDLLEIKDTLDSGINPLN